MVTVSDFLPGVPVELPTIDGLSTGESNILDRLIRQWSAHLERNRARAARYDGDNLIQHLGIATPPHLKNTRLVLGWPAMAVDYLNRRCHLDDFSLPGQDITGLAFVDLWKANRASATLTQTQTSSLIQGLAWLVVTQGDTADGEPDVLVTAKDALSATGTWNSRAKRMDNFLSITSVDENGRPTGLVLYLHNLIVNCEKKVGGWKVTRQEHIYGVPVEPLTYGSNLASPLGRSRITRAMMSLHDSALRTALRSEITAEFYSVPQTIILGADSSVFGGGSWRSVIGRWLSIPDLLDEDVDPKLARADVKQLQSAPQTPHIEQLRMWSQLYAAEARISPAALGIISDGNPTSEGSYVASREDIVTDAWAAIEEWSPGILGAAIRMEQIARRVEVPPQDLKNLALTWRDPIFVSKSQAADAGFKQLAAAPWLTETEVGLELIGLSKSQIDRALGDKNRAQAKARANALLGLGNSSGQQG